MRLYHFTSRFHLPNILQDGMLIPTDANLFRTGPSPATPNEPVRGQKVVWLLDEPEAGGGQQANGLYAAKREVRIEVDVPDAQRWLDWVTTRRHDPEWVRIIVRQGGGKSRAKHWWVVARPIPSTEWVVTEVLTPNAPLL
jgi:hypothetical protein